LNEIKDQVANLAAENARLRAQVPSPAARIGENGDARSRTLLSRRGLLAAGASATAAGLLIAGRATPALAANGDPVLLGDSTNSATADTVITTTSALGLKAESTSTSGIGVSGLASASSNHATFGVRGEYGVANATSGKTYGVCGQTSSPGGYSLYGQGRLKVAGRSYLGTPDSAPADGDLNLGSISFYLDETNSKLKVRVKYSTGVLKTATIALA
jgi:hypothetical protein